MKKIVFNGCWIGTNVVGVSRYAFNIIKIIDEMLITNDSGVEIELAVPRSYIIDNLSFQKIRIVKIGNYKGKFRKIIWEQFSFPYYIKKENAIGVDLTLSMPILGVHYIAIHDCIYETFPENYKDHEIHRTMYLWKVKRIANNKKVKIITVSNESKKEIEKYYGVNPKRISVIGNGWEHMNNIIPDYSILEKLKIKTDYFFSLGSRYKHKNLQWILKTAKINPQYSFILTGNDSFSDELSNLKQNPISNVYFTGYVSDSEMKALMLSCKALIQPSLYEGFGIPPLEALSLGKKIIVSNVSCLPEIYGNSAYYIDPNSFGCDLNELLDKPVEPPINILKKYSWIESASKMYDLLTT